MAELHLALGHDVQAVTEIAFVEEGLTAAKGCMTHLLLEGHLLCIVKATEQRHLADEVAVTDHGAELLPLVPDCSGVPIEVCGESHTLHRSLGGAAHTIMPYLSGETCFIVRFV